MIFRNFKYSIAAVVSLLAFLGVGNTAMAQGVEAYIGGGVTRSDVDCDRTASRMGTIGGNPATVTGSISCDNEYGFQIHAGADYVSDQGWLLGVEIGYLSQDTETDVGVTLDPPPTAVTLSVGGGDIEARTIFYGIRGGFNLLEDRLTPYVRVGLHTYDADYPTYTITATPVGGGTPASAPFTLSDSDGTEFYYGVGVEYDVWKENGQGIGVRLDYTRYDFDDVGDLDVIGLTAHYEFGLNY